MRGSLVLLAVGSVGLAGQPPSGGELTPMTQPLTSAGFEEIGSTDGVTVFEDPDSAIIRVAAEGEIAAPPERVLEALLAYDLQPGVVARVSESEVLERGHERMVVYQHLNLPVISDRDYVLRVRWGSEAGVTWLAYTAVTDVGPEEKDGVVRVTNHAGSWQLEPAGDGEGTKARFQMRMDLAGTLPRWMARSHATDEVPALFQSILCLAAAEAGE